MFKRTIVSALAAVLAIAGIAYAQIPVGNLREYVITITPVATAAAIGTTEQTFTATGVTVDDVVYINSPAAPTALCPVVGIRVSAANTVALQFATMTAAACTPAAGNYKIIATR